LARLTVLALEDFSARNFARLVAACILAVSAIGGAAAQDTHRPAVAPAPDIPANPALRLVARIAMPHMSGTWDHLAADAKTARLFLSAQEDHAVDIVDLRAARPILRMIGNFNRPQGQFYIPELNKLVVTNGKDGTAKIFRGDTYQLTTTIPLSLGADMMEYDPNTKYLYVEHGGRDSNRGPGKLSVVDAVSETVVGSIDTDLRSASLAIETSRPRLYDALPGANQVAVIDTNARQIVKRFDLPGRPASLALDERNHRLFVATRSVAGNRTPPTFLVLDTESGKAVATLEGIDGSEGLWYDAPHRRIYSTGLEGYVQAYQQVDPDHYAVLATIRTRDHAGTSQFIPELNRLCVALAPHDHEAAEVWIFEPLP
jgi:hypothetical protein